MGIVVSALPIHHHTYFATLRATNEDELTAGHRFAYSSFPYRLGLPVTAGSSPTTEAALSDLIGKRPRVPGSSSHLFTPSTQWTLLSVWNPIRQSHTCEPCQRLLWARIGVCILHASFKTKGWGFLLSLNIEKWKDVYTFEALLVFYVHFRMSASYFSSIYFYPYFPPSVDPV